MLNYKNDSEMKKLKILILSVAGMAIMGSCSDSWLDTEPLTLLTDANFYRTPADAEMALVGCYDGLQLIYATDAPAFPVLSEVLSDNAFGGTGHVDAYHYQLIDEFDLQRSPGHINMFEASWINYYRAIYRVNVLLQKMDQVEWGNRIAQRNSIEAQARFLRAYFYFDMARIWERVPLLTEPTTENLPQAEPAELYKLIAEDLLFAATHGDTTVSPGRINRWAAKAYLARVYLFYTGYYGAPDLAGVVGRQAVLQGLEEIIKSNNYGLIADFKNLWPAASSHPNSTGTGLVSTFAGKDNRETIFAIKYNITSNWDGRVDGNHWLVMLGLRGQTFSPYGRGWGACPVDPALFHAFAPNDQRRDASIIAIDREGLDFDYSGQREFTGFFNKKYLPLANPDGQDVAEANGGSSFMISQFQDYVVMRYADVLLMAAELGSPNAQNYLNQVRARAGLGPIPVTPENILAERRFEFAFEGIRYWDLLRQGLETAATTIARNTSVKNGGVETNKVITAANIRRTRGFQMIPLNQINLSGGVLKQNAGWY